MPPSEKRRYTPLTPSPLNPNTRPDDQPNKKTRTPSRPKHPDGKPKPTRSPRPPNINNATSPTQYLLRQKAAAAWRSATLRRHHVVLIPQSYHEHAVVSKEKDDSVRDWATDSTTISFLDDDNEEEEGGDIGLGVVAKRDNRRDAARDDFGMVSNGMDVLPLLEPELELMRAHKWVLPVRNDRRAGMTVRRVLVVLGLVFGLGLVHGLVQAFGSGEGRETRRPAQAGI